MRLFKKKTVTKVYDKENKKPVIKASICNGEENVWNRWRDREGILNEVFEVMLSFTPASI